MKYIQIQILPNIIIKAIFVFFLVLTNDNVYSANADTLNRTTHKVYFATGYTVSVAAFSLVYEKDLLKLETRNPAMLNARIGYGMYGFLWGNHGSHLFSGLGLVTGQNKHHFESSLGVAVLLDNVGFRYDLRDDDINRGLGYYLDWYPSAYIGYRYKKPSGRFLFRAGIGWPDQLGVGMGFAF